MPKIDASGAAGRDGANGYGFAGQRAVAGQRGRHAGDASPGQPGQDGGLLDIQLRTSPVAANLVEINGQVVPAGGLPRPVRETTDFRSNEQLELFACGGPGGRGGDGGVGEDGGRGGDGAAATRWSSGHDGDPGGDGGNGGRGADGGRGGNGGSILVRVDRRDTHLLMLVSHRHDGGEGGVAGAHGKGGAGGPGGKGGAEYTWTSESSETYTDPSGNPQVRTITHHHRQPGGSDGRRGRSGSDGQGPLHPGPSGKPGAFQILVDYDGRRAQFSQRYAIDIVDYELVLTDTFAEPTSPVRLQRLTLRNSGGMPTPESFPVIVSLSPGRFLNPDSVPLSLPHPLGPGEQYTFTPEELCGRIADWQEPVVGEPLRESDEVFPIAIQSGVDRPFANLHPKRTIEIAFPAELEPVQSLESQTPGRMARFRVRVSNRSSQTIGSESPSRRALKLRIDLAEPELARHLMLVDRSGRVVPWETGYETELASLAAGQTEMVETLLGVLPDAPGYQHARLRVTLWLGQLDNPGEARPRHERPFTLRIAQPYRFDPEAEFLLIANHGTTAEEKQAWEGLIGSFGKRLNVWDISLNDALSLRLTLPHGENLLRDFHGKTLILNNAPFATPLGTRYADQFLGQMDLIEAAASHDIRMLIVNPVEHDIRHLFGSRLVPTDGEPEFRYVSISQFRRAQPQSQAEVVLEQVRELVERGARAAQPSPLTQTSRIAVYGLRAPNPRRLRRQAERLQRELEARSPGRRYVVLYEVPQQDSREFPATSAGGWFFSHVLQGTLTVMPTLSELHPNLVVLEAPAEKLRAPDFVSGETVTKGLLQAIRFQDKVALLDAQLRELSGPPESFPPGNAVSPEPSASSATRTVRRDDLLGRTESLVDAILTDLAVEQGGVLKSGWKPLVFRELSAALEKLAFLSDFPLKLITSQAGEPDARLALRLIAGVRNLARAACRWYERWWFPWGPFRRGASLRSETLVAAEKLSRNLFRRLTPEHEQIIQEELEKFDQRRRVAQKSKKLSKQAARRRAVTSLAVTPGMQLDVEHSFPRVYSRQEWEAIRAAENEREDARLALQQEKRRNVAEYQVAVAGQPLPGLDADTVTAVQPFCEAAAAGMAAVSQRAP